ncbi:MAG: hypothetical protein ACFFB3_23165, partial [Candidatus Hodarchaeota archaeon]
TGIVYYGKYHRLSEEELDKISADYDDKDKHLMFDVDWRKEGYKHYLDRYFTNRLQWFQTDIRSKEASIYNTLKDVGFLNKDQ